MRMARTEGRTVGVEVVKSRGGPGQKGGDLETDAVSDGGTGSWTLNGES
jgi:hypothetical protein